MVVKDSSTVVSSVEPSGTLKKIGQLVSADSNTASPLDSLDTAILALELLRSVPVARDAALEVLFRFFTTSTQAHFTKTAPLQGAQELFASVKETLETAVTNSPKIWLKLVLKWSSNFLISVTKTPKAYFVAPLEDSCHTWLMCPPTNTCMQILITCVQQCSDKAQRDDVVLQLLAQVSESLPNAEWIIAHLAMKQPDLFLTTLVEQSVKQFYDQCDQIGFSLTTTLTQAPMKSSFIDTVAYLSHFHRPLVQSAVLSPLQTAVVNSRPRNSLVCLSHLINCCERFPDLRDVILQGLVSTLDYDFLEKWMLTLEKAVENADRRTIETHVSQAIGLLMRNGPQSYALIKFLMDAHCINVTKKIAKRHHSSINTFLHIVLLEVQRLAHSRYFSPKISYTDQLLVSELALHHDFICDLYWIAKTHKQAEFAKLYLRALCLSEGDIFCANIILMFIRNNQFRNDSILDILSVIKEIKLCLPNVYHHFTLKITQLTSKDEAMVIKCLNAVLFVLKSNTDEADFQRKRLISGFSRHIAGLVKFLAFSNVEVNKATLRLLCIVDVVKAMEHSSSSAVILKLTASCFTLCVMNMLKRTAIDSERVILTEYMIKFARAFSHSELGRAILVQNLIDAAVSVNFKVHFGGLIEKPVKQDTYISLLQQNRVLNRGKCSIGSTSNSLQSKHTLKKVITDENLISSNTQIFLQLLTTVLTKTDNTSLLDENLTLILARRLLQFVCPEISYTQNLWPDSESEKQFLDRDMKVFNTYVNNPILWDLVELISQVRPVLCYCTILLYPVLEVVRNFWESNRCEGTSECKDNLLYTMYLFKYMRNSQLIPIQLSCLDEIISYISPYEANVILSTCWKYIQENPPDVDSYTTPSKTAYPEKKYMRVLSPQFADSIHLIFLSNISSLGRFFPKYLTLQASNAVF